MDADQFLSEINNSNVQKYILHNKTTDVVFTAFSATDKVQSIDISGVWINIAGVTAYPCGYDTITIKKEDIINWVFVDKPVGKLSQDAKVHI